MKQPQPYKPIATPYTPIKAVCLALDALCDRALRQQQAGFAWGRPRYEQARWLPPAPPPAVAEAKEGGAGPKQGMGMGGRRPVPPVMAEAKGDGGGTRVQALRKVGRGRMDRRAVD